DDRPAPGRGGPDVPRHVAASLPRRGARSGMMSGESGTLALGLVIAGAVSGLTAGMLGVGGGIVVVPVLYHVLGLMGIDPGVRMHLAVGTSLATIIPTAFASVRAHDGKGAVDWALLKRWCVPM